MTLHIPFDNSYARLPAAFHTRLNPMPVKDPQLIHFNHALATSLGITYGTETELTEAFSGNQPPEGSAPLAQAYAGHQFGGFSPQLGDGRANLLGEVRAHDGQRFDIQLKGSGPTPYSRNGDGRAWLGPVLREYVVSEAMHALGIPTSRALAAVSTGESIYRENGAMPGAVLTRVAASHIRVGTFQYFAARHDLSSLKQLFEYVQERHYPQADGPTELLDTVIERQAELIAGWMSVGFIHGVMNTDNTTLSGETIDYGPCAFIDRYHPDTKFSSIDVQGRYAYSNQPHIIVWNMAQLATSLIPLMPDQDDAVEVFTKAVHGMPARVHQAWLRQFGAKIGLQDASVEDEGLITGLLQIMAEGRADFPNTFRALGTGTARDQFLDPTLFDTWEVEWRTRLDKETDVDERMQTANPAFIPRNHQVEQTIAAAVAGDFAPFKRLLSALQTPYQDQADAADLKQPPQSHEVVQQTFCGT